jgi:hypothetical protein
MQHAYDGRRTSHGRNVGEALTVMHKYIFALSTCLSMAIWNYDGNMVNVEDYATALDQGTAVLLKASRKLFQDAVPQDFERHALKQIPFFHRWTGCLTEGSDFAGTNWRQYKRNFDRYGIPPPKHAQQFLPCEDIDDEASDWFIFQHSEIPAHVSVASVIANLPLIRLVNAKSGKVLTLNGNEVTTTNPRQLKTWTCQWKMWGYCFKWGHTWLDSSADQWMVAFPTCWGNDDMFLPVTMNQGSDTSDTAALVIEPLWYMYDTYAGASAKYGSEVRTVMARKLQADRYNKKRNVNKVLEAENVVDECTRQRFCYDTLLDGCPLAPCEKTKWHGNGWWQTPYHPNWCRQ